MKYELINFCEFDKYASKAYSLIHNETDSKNLGDITKINEKELADFNMMVGGSPCQDFSVAGKQEGAKWTCDECGYEYNPLEAHYTTRDKCPKCGSSNIEKTRSSLLVEWLRVLRAKKPNLAIYENVKNIVGKQFKSTFDLFEKELHEYGYNTYWKVLNAKCYGVPQNRERVYLIIIKKEIDNGKFKFPQEFDNGIRLKHLLENNIEDKYYLSEDVQKRLKFNKKSTNNDIVGTTKPDFRTIGQRDLVYGTDGVMGCLVATDYKQPKQILEVDEKYYLKDTKDFFIKNSFDMEARGNGFRFEPHVKGNADIAKCITTRAGGRMDDNYIIDIDSEQEKFKFDNTNKELITINEINIIGNLDIKGQDNIKRVYNQERINPTLTAMEGGNRQPKILENTNELINLGNVYPSGGQAGNVFDENGISPTLVTFTGGGGKQPLVVKNNEYKIRKLTPLECFRLMGFSDKDYYILKENGMSDSQCYKMAGNSIVVDVLYYILLELYKAMPYLLEDIKLSSFFSGIGAFEKAILRLQETVNNNKILI